MLSGATVTHSGNLIDLGPSWRNQDVAKPLDIDGNQVLGSDGYHLVNLPPVLPSYVSESTIVSSTYPGNAEYSLLDDPGRPDESFLTGTINPGPGAGNSSALLAFKLNASAEGRLIRVGLLVDNLDGAAWNASGVSLVQTDNPQSSSEPIPTVAPVLNNRVPDWVFFDITGGKAGDTFVLRAIGGANGTATVGGVVFDSLHPDGGPVRTSSQGIANVYPSRAVLGEPPQGLYRMTLTLSNLTCPAQGMSVLLVGPGGQKIRPMSHAFGTFDTADGPTVLTFDDLADLPFPVLQEGAIARGSYRPDTDQSPPDLPAPAPAGPYSSPMSTAQAGQVAGVWSLYVAGTSVRLDSWSLRMVPMHPPSLTNFTSWYSFPGTVPHSMEYIAGLAAWITPGGLRTVAWMEWGPTPEMGHATPVKDLGDGNVPVEFFESIPPELGGTFHTRVGTSNRLGVTYTSQVALPLPSYLMTFPTGATPLRGVLPECVDFDNDGMLDLFLTFDHSSGAPETQVRPGIWRNTGTRFSRQAQPSMTALTPGQAAPGDADNDGRLDFLMTGRTETGPTSQLWFNTGTPNSYFERIDLRGIPTLGPGAVTWGDYDNDGRVDFLFTGSQNQRPVGQLWRNSGAGFVNVTASTLPGFPAFANGSAAWGDYDRDGWLDILVSGSTESGGGTTQIWRNTGNGFTRLPDSATPGLPQLELSTVAWGDYDNDGLLDFLIVGESVGGENTTQIWRNTGNGFTNVTAQVASQIRGTPEGTASWADYDNDGRLDILIVGRVQPGSGSRQLWRNTGTGFTNVSIDTFPSSDLRYSTGRWADMDSDGRLDLVLTGETETFESLLEISRSRVWTTNTPPNPPTGLTVSSGPKGVTFSWKAATDAQTPSSGLSYHLRVGTTPGGSDLVSAMAGSDGRPLLTRDGAIRPGLTRTITGLPTGRTLYWSVQAQDTAYAGSRFADGQPITVGNALATTTGELIPGDSNGDGLVDDRELSLVLAKLAGGLRPLNAAGYYSPSQIQALNVGRPMLEQLPSGQFKLTLGLEKATRLTNFVAIPFLPSQTSINAEGKLEYLFSSPDDAAFFRVEAR